MYKDRKKYLAAHLKYNEAHREERRVLAVKWRKENREKKKKYDKEYNKKWLKNYIKNNPEVYKKYQARRKFKYAIKSGKIIRQKCIINNCKEMGQGHHEDYSKPLEVMWLCQKHHNEHHMKLKNIV